ncbi:hypothetical protein FOL47_005170 [Perkinsus chesapeaki]|uniref:Uncharacterized protein n=1 Tax=Perkinsus chesapeaki TaxID=330153 RepID=A0A7J6MYP3_PERCH|nr:hypothetical protein FOL47_005170 [Perkinsus chesapeaki]
MAYHYHKARQVGLSTAFPVSYRNNLLNALTSGHRPEQELLVTNDAISAIAVNPFTQDLLAVACRRGAVFLHRLHEDLPEEPVRLREDTSSLRRNFMGFACIKFLASHVACGARDRSVEVYDCTTEQARKVKRFQTVSETSAFAVCPAFSSPLVAAGLEQGGLEIFDIRRRSSVGEPFLGMEGSCTGLQFIDEYHIVGGSRRGEVLLWDIRLVHKTPLLEFGRSQPMSGMTPLAGGGVKGPRGTKRPSVDQHEEAVWRYVINHERQGRTRPQVVSSGQSDGKRPKKRIGRNLRAEGRVNEPARPLRFYSPVSLGVKLMSGKYRPITFSPGRTLIGGGLQTSVKRRHGKSSQLGRVHDILPPVSWDSGVVYVMADLGIHRYNATDGSKLSFTRFPHVGHSVACVLDGLNSIAIANRDGMSIWSEDGMDRRCRVQGHIYVMSGLAWSSRLGTILSCGAEGTVNR